MLEAIENPDVKSFIEIVKQKFCPLGLLGDNESETFKTPIKFAGASSKKDKKVPTLSMKQATEAKLDEEGDDDEEEVVDDKPVVAKKLPTTRRKVLDALNTAYLNNIPMDDPRHYLEMKAKGPGDPLWEKAKKDALKILQDSGIENLVEEVKIYRALLISAG